MIIAKKTREETKNLSAPISLNNIVKKIGIKTKVNNAINQDALLSIQNNGYKIEYNNSINWRRQRFTIAHEIMHTIIYDLFHSIINFKKIEIKKLEQLCDFGASEILMPSQLVREKIDGKSINFNLLTELSNTFKVSFTAISRKINYINPNRSIYIWKKHSRKAGEKISFRVYKAYQTYTSAIDYPYIPIGCSVKHLSDKGVFETETDVQNGKIKVKLSQEKEYEYYIEEIKQKANELDLFYNNQSQKGNFLMILTTI